MKKILAIDPSGNFTEGKGTTGWALVTDTKVIITVGQVLAKNYSTIIDYWSALVNLIENLQPDIVVIEDYLLYKDKAQAQILSRLETARVIGVLEFTCARKEIPCHFQRAIDVKKRWTDDILVTKGYVQKQNNRYYAGGVLISDHIRDAIRHGIHYATYKIKE